MNPLWSTRGERYFNKRFAGRAVGYKDTGGYKFITLWGIRYQTHRVIWKMATGKEPDCIDHINGDVADNRLENLRSIPPGENNKNCKMPKSNTTGVMGVHIDSRNGHYKARFRVDGKKLHLGVFDTLEEAATAVEAAKAEYGYHPNHGRKPKGTAT